MRFIITADLHLRPDVPRCRKQTQEEWIETQRSQLRFIASKAIEYESPIIICGDIFNTPTVPDYIKTIFIDTFYLRCSLYAISGQHDLLWHQWEKVNQSSYGVLLNAGLLPPPPDKYAHYDQEIRGSGDMLFLHTLIFQDKTHIPPNTKAMTAQEALDKYPDIKWIFAGDLHAGYIYKSEDRYVIVPGCMNTQKSDEDYSHYIYYVDTERINVERIEIPDNCEVVTDAYVQESQDRLNKVHSFVTLIKEKIQQEKGSGIDFKENVRKAMINNSNLTLGAIKIIEQLLEK